MSESLEHELRLALEARGAQHSEQEALWSLPSEAKKIEAASDTEAAARSDIDERRMGREVRPKQEDATEGDAVLVLTDEATIEEAEQAVDEASTSMEAMEDFD